MAAGGIPRWVWIFTPAVALTFVGFLFYLSTLPAGNDVDKILPSLTTQSSAGKPKQNRSTVDSKPAQEENAANTKTDVGEYEFYRLLEDKKVDIPEVSEYKSTPKGQSKNGKKIVYRLQAGSFSNQSDADRMKASLILNGMDSQIQSADVNGKTWYRVFVGPFDNRSRMNKAQDVLAEMRIQPLVLKEEVN